MKVIDIFKDMTTTIMMALFGELILRGPLTGIEFHAANIFQRRPRGNWRHICENLETMER